jgi:hypothetical protein
MQMFYCQLPTIYPRGIGFGALKGILKLVLTYIFSTRDEGCFLDFGDIYETLTRFLSMKLCKSDIIR